jgi:hypothetical protein
MNTQRGSAATSLPMRDPPSSFAGAPYDFRLAMTMQNASGALWEVTMFDPTDRTTMSVGKIFFVDAPLSLPKRCRALGQPQSPPAPGLSAHTFLEYFEAPFDFATIATWSNFTAFSPEQNKAYKVPNIVNDCCGRTYGKPPTGAFLHTSRRCLPPECDDLELTMMCGPFVKPTESMVAANLSCLKADRPQDASPTRGMHDCWRDEPPASLDECFARPSTV